MSGDELVPVTDERGQTVWVTGRRMPAPTRTRSGPMTSPPTDKAASRAGAMAPEAATTTGLVDCIRGQSDRAGLIRR
jgi:hypothetical protein